MMLVCVLTALSCAGEIWRPAEREHPSLTLSRGEIADSKGRLYPDVTLRREVTVTARHVLDVYSVECEQPRQIDFLLHASSDAQSLAAREPGRATPLSFSPHEFPKHGAWRWLVNGRRTESDASLELSWKAGDVQVRATVTGAPTTQLILCDFPRNDRFEPPAIPMAILRRYGVTTRFAVRYQAERRK